jgi:hypothetical protein
VKNQIEVLMEKTVPEIDILHALGYDADSLSHSGSRSVSRSASHSATGSATGSAASASGKGGGKGSPGDSVISVGGSSGAGGGLNKSRRSMGGLSKSPGSDRRSNNSNSIPAAAGSAWSPQTVIGEAAAVGSDRNQEESNMKQSPISIAIEETQAKAATPSPKLRIPPAPFSPNQSNTASPKINHSSSKPSSFWPNSNTELEVTRKVSSPKPFSPKRSSLSPSKELELTQRFRDYHGLIELAFEHAGDFDQFEDLIIARHEECKAVAEGILRDVVADHFCATAFSNYLTNIEAGFEFSGED